MHERCNRHFNPVALVAVLALALVAGAPAMAQTTTAGLRGVVKDATGPIPTAQIIAVNKNSGFEYRAVSETDGTFTLVGLAAGQYDLRVSFEGYQEVSQSIELQLGRTVDVTIELRPQEMFLGNVAVVGETTKLLIDTRSPEIATNITTQQIENLPQNNRNFLSFAALAPGVQFTDNTDSQGQVFRSGGANPKQVNVFIDGLSYKNDIIQGGAFMQDSSRGNPFPQGAVQEYQVITQNYKAEYEKSAAAVITAVTKSGGNDFHGDLFYLFQDKSMLTQDEFAKARGDSKPPYERNQYGLSVGGPIMKDKLHFFVSAEHSERDLIFSIFRGGEYANAPANVKAKLDPYQTGALSKPFEETLYFGKVTFQPTVSQTMDLSFHRRDEEEFRDFGGQVTVDGARDFKVGTDAAVLRHQGVIGSSLFNEASLTYQKMSWQQIATTTGAVRENYRGLLTIGAPDFTQDLSQEKTGLRNDLTYMFDWLGGHTVKAGAVVNWMKYNLTKASYYNPYYEYRSDEGWQFPFLARFGFGDPSLDFKNTQYGVFIQDDWRLAPNLTVNVGLRWDYESNMLNNDWVTPASIVTGLQNSCRDYAQPIGGQTTWCVDEIFDIDNYVSTGNNRKSPTNMYQPRLGFSWDASGKGSTVVFGGWGMYYDRVTLNDIYDEQYRQSWSQYTFCFSADGSTVNGCGAGIAWDPAYLTADGLAGLISSGQIGGKEVFLLANDTHAPRSTQWTLGIRQQLGNWLAAFTYANSRGHNGLSWSFGTLPEASPFNDRWGNSIPIPGYGLVIRSSDVRKTWYDGYFLTLDRPYTADAKWGANIAYTYGKAYQNGTLDEGTAFSFDYVSANDYYKFPANTDERHRLVASGTVGLPFGFIASSIVTLGSGMPYTYTNCIADGGLCQAQFNRGRPAKKSFLGLKEFAYRSVDLRVEWSANLGSAVRLGLTGEAFNLFNFANDSCFDGWAGTTGSPNPNFGKATCQFNTRRFQVGAKFGF